jgi:phospholipid transport system substrate-binding protein
MTESYGRYISAIYADRFDSYAGQKLEVIGEQPAPSGVMVKSQIIKANGGPVKVDYMMRRSGDSSPGLCRATGHAYRSHQYG